MSIDGGELDTTKGRMQDIDAQTLIDTIPIPVLVIGPDERIRAANGPALTFLGSDPKGRHYITAIRQPAILDLIESALTEGTRHSAPYLSRDGSRDTVLRATVSPLVLTPEGKPGQAGSQGAIVAFEDLSAIEEAGQMRRDFVANVSHELRTPLTALLGFIETLRGAARNDPAARDRFLGIMEQEAGRMSRLVQDLLSLSRVEADERVRPLEDVDLSDVIRTAERSLTAQADKAGVLLDLDLPPGAVMVPGDANQLRQVMNNLIENGIKYGGSGGRLDIGLQVLDHDPVLRAPGVRITVTDHGDGIADHHIARLTERFYRVDTHRSREVGGTGLGLAIVKHIINRHRGRLRIDSKPGAGATFTVILPL